MLRSIRSPKPSGQIVLCIRLPGFAQVGDCSELFVVETERYRRGKSFTWRSALGKPNAFCRASEYWVAYDVRLWGLPPDFGRPHADTGLGRRKPCGAGERDLSARRGRS